LSLPLLLPLGPLATASASAVTFATATALLKILPFFFHVTSHPAPLMIKIKSRQENTTQMGHLLYLILQ
jgi:hypothetical protein